MARSTGSADRPFVGRSAAAVFGLLVALLASLAIGAAAPRASADSQLAEQASETEQSTTATASPAAAGAPAAPAQAEPSAPAEPSTPAEQEPAAVADEPAEPASPPAETEVPQDGEPGPSNGPTAGQPPADAAPAPAEPTEIEPTETEPVDPEPAEPPSASATAQNRSQTRQAIFQVQQGCRGHCQGTSQSQSAAGVPPEEPAPTPSTAVGAPPSRSPQTFAVRVTATWRRVSGQGRSQARIRRSSSATALAEPGSGLTTHARVGSSARVEAGFSTAKTPTSATTSTTSGSDTGSADFPYVSDEPLSGLEKPDWGFSTAGWILIGLLLACGVALLRKTHLRRPVV